MEKDMTGVQNAYWPEIKVIQLGTDVNKYLYANNIMLKCI